MTKDKGSEVFGRNRISFVIIYIHLALLSILFAQSWHPDCTHRPRLVYLSSELEDIRERLASGVYNQLWSNEFQSRRGNFVKGIYQKASLNQEPVLNTEEEPRKFADNRSWIANCAAFVYAMNKRADGITELNDFTGDADPHPRDWYRDHAIEYLQSMDTVVLGPDNISEWTDKAEFVNNWQWRAKELIYYCQAYDMLLGMEVEIPDTIEIHIERFAQNLYQKYTAQGVEQVLLAKNNHRLMSAAALGLAAVTLNESEYAHDWIQLAMSVIQYVLYEDGSDGDRLVDSDGGYAEGPYYFRYSFKHLIPFFIAMRNFKGDWTEDYTYKGKTRSLRSPWYDPQYYSIYDWITKIRMPEGRLPALEDSFQDHYLPDLAVFGGNYVWPYQSFDEGISNEALLNWQLADPFDLRIEYIVAGNAGSEDVPPPWENVQILPEAGSAVFRSDWGAEARYFHLYGQHGTAREAGSNHDHADVTSFILGYKGQVLALDAGYIRWNYHYQVNKPENHNVILIDGYGPKPPSGPVTRGLTYYSAPSPTDGYLKNKYIARDFAHVDVTAEYGRHYEMVDSLNGQEAWEFVEGDTTLVEVSRSVLLVDNLYFIISDELNNTDSSIKRYQLLLHGNGGGTSGGSYEQHPNGALWTQGNANLQAYVTSRDGDALVDDSLFTHGDGFLTTKTHRCLRATKESVDTQFLTVLYPSEGPQFLSIFDISSSEYTGLVLDRTVQELGARYDIVVSQQIQDTMYIPEQAFGSIVVKSIRSDAELLLMSFDKNEPDRPDLMKIFGKNLTFISYDDGRIIFEPDSEITSSFSYQVGAISADNAALPKKYSLEQNYPNPFNPKTIISWQLAVGSEVELSVYNLLGQKVATLVSGKQKAGLHSVDWDASGFASGIFFYRLTTDRGFADTKKLVLLR